MISFKFSTIFFNCLVINPLINIILIKIFACFFLTGHFTQKSGISESFVFNFACGREYTRDFVVKSLVLDE